MVPKHLRHAPTSLQAPRVTAVREKATDKVVDRRNRKEQSHKNGSTCDNHPGASETTPQRLWSSVITSGETDLGIKIAKILPGRIPKFKTSHPTTSHPTDVHAQSSKSISCEESSQQIAKNPQEACHAKDACKTLIPSTSDLVVDVGASVASVDCAQTMPSAQLVNAPSDPPASLSASQNVSTPLQPSASILHLHSAPPTDQSTKLHRSRKRIRLDSDSTPRLSHPTPGPICEPEMESITIKDDRPRPRKIAYRRTSGGITGRWVRLDQGIESLGNGGRQLPDAVGDQLEREFADGSMIFSDWTQTLRDGYDTDSTVQEGEEEPQEEASYTGSSSKPPLTSPPPIWAQVIFPWHVSRHSHYPQSRQEVCESLQHFRSYHSGVYSKKDIVKGYLLGAFAARYLSFSFAGKYCLSCSRDIFCHGGKLVISHGCAYCLLVNII